MSSAIHSLPDPGAQSIELSNLDAAHTRRTETDPLESSDDSDNDHDNNHDNDENDSDDDEDVFVDAQSTWSTDDNPSKAQQSAKFSRILCALPTLHIASIQSILSKFWTWLHDYVLSYRAAILWMTSVGVAGTCIQTIFQVISVHTQQQQADSQSGMQKRALAVWHDSIHLLTMPIKIFMLGTLFIGANIVSIVVLTLIYVFSYEYLRPGRRAIISGLLTFFILMLASLWSCCLLYFVLLITRSR